MESRHARLYSILLPTILSALASVVFHEHSEGTGGQPPTCDAGGPYGGLLGFPIEFDGTGSTDPDGTIVTYEWNFGDGTSGKGPTPSHTYDLPGTFTVILTVTDDTQLASSCSTTVVVDVDNMPPICDAGGPYWGRSGRRSSSTERVPWVFPPHVIILYEWDFGDGGNGTGPTPTHVYLEEGAFTVTLTVTDDNNGISSCTSTASVTPLPVEPSTWGAIKNQMRLSVQRLGYRIKATRRLTSPPGHWRS